MAHPGFFHRAGPFPLWFIAEKVGARLSDSKDGSCMIEDVRPLRNAGAVDLAFFENRKYMSQLAATKARACILSESDAGRVPEETAVLASATPYETFARALALFYPDALRSKAAAA